MSAPLPAVLICAALTEAGFRIQARTSWAVQARHDVAEADLRAAFFPEIGWKFAVFVAASTYQLRPATVGELVGLLTATFGADTRRKGVR